MISKFLKIRLSVSWIKYLGAEKNIALCVILETNCMGKLKLQLWIICIDNSYAKFISPVAHIYLAVLAIANAILLQNWVSLRVAWHEPN